MQPSGAKTAGVPLLASVIIPTYNRMRHLAQCLKHLEAQTCGNFEVIVVDDGSSDGTLECLNTYGASAPMAFRSLHQANAGPARARNLAISQMRSPLCIMIGDDTFPEPDFVRTHVAFHETHPAVQDAAVGLTRWSEEGQTVTPLMRWLESDGVQFAYGPLLAGIPPDWHHFYTSNLSIKADLLGSSPFHEGFRIAGVEDVELGYRLTVTGGLRLTFLREAVTRHLHPCDFTGTCRRAQAIGEAMFQFDELWPDQRPDKRAVKARILRALLRIPFFLPLLTFAARAATGVRCPNPLLARAIQLHTLAGYERAASRPVPSMGRST
jgi:Glycosyl transferase family 2